MLYRHAFTNDGPRYHAQTRFWQTLVLGICLVIAAYEALLATEPSQMVLTTLIVLVCVFSTLVLLPLVERFLPKLVVKGRVARKSVGVPSSSDLHNNRGPIALLGAKNENVQDFLHLDERDFYFLINLKGFWRGLKVNRRMFHSLEVDHEITAEVYPLTRYVRTLSFSTTRPLPKQTIAEQVAIEVASSRQRDRRLMIIWGVVIGLIIFTVNVVRILIFF